MKTIEAYSQFEMNDEAIKMPSPFELVHEKCSGGFTWFSKSCRNCNTSDSRIRVSLNNQLINLFIYFLLFFFNSLCSLYIAVSKCQLICYCSVILPMLLIVFDRNFCSRLFQRQCVSHCTRNFCVWVSLRNIKHQNNQIEQCECKQHIFVVQLHCIKTCIKWTIISDVMTGWWMNRRWKYQFRIEFTFIRRKYWNEPKFALQPYGSSTKPDETPHTWRPFQNVHNSTNVK